MIPPRFRILLVHNHYQNPGGEDAVFEAEKNLLVQNGHHVLSFERENAEIRQFSLWENMKLAKRTIWAEDSVHQLRRLIQNDKPDIAHFHNTFPLISPAAYWAVRDENIPVVQTLHNFRIFCAAATFMRDGQICQKCLTKYAPWPSVYHRCYHDSMLQSAVVASMQTYHRYRRTWSTQVNAYIALTDFSRSKYIEGGLPADRIFVKPNFLEIDPGAQEKLGEYALFIGRLDAQKGVKTLLEAWSSLPEIPLLIAGDGELFDELARIVSHGKMQNVRLLGQQTKNEVINLIKKARCVIIPSIGYEGFPRVVAEAYACGVPVIASHLGSLAELVDDGVTGLHFSPGSAEDLRQKVLQLWSDEAAAFQLGKNARSKFEKHYSASENYTQLMRIYGSIVSS